ncbi:MAG: hypothetical protein AAF328_10685 [Planctomycetota bacterium]
MISKTLERVEIASRIDAYAGGGVLHHPGQPAAIETAVTDQHHGGRWRF